MVAPDYRWEERGGGDGWMEVIYQFLAELGFEPGKSWFAGLASMLHYRFTSIISMTRLLGIIIHVYNKEKSN